MYVCTYLFANCLKLSRDGKADLNYLNCIERLDTSSVVDYLYRVTRF